MVAPQLTLSSSGPDARGPPADLLRVGLGEASEEDRDHAKVHGLQTVPAVPTPDMRDNQLVLLLKI